MRIENVLGSGLALLLLLLWRLPESSSYYPFYRYWECNYDSDCVRQCSAKYNCFYTTAYHWLEWPESYCVLCEGPYSNRRCPTRRTTTRRTTTTTRPTTTTRRTTTTTTTTTTRPTTTTAYAPKPTTPKPPKTTIDPNANNSTDWLDDDTDCNLYSLYVSYFVTVLSLIYCLLIFLCFGAECCGCAFLLISRRGYRGTYYGRRAPAAAMVSRTGAADAESLGSSEGSSSSSSSDSGKGPQKVNVLIKVNKNNKIEPDETSNPPPI